MLPLRTFSFHDFGRSPELELPARLVAVGHERCNSRDYRWDNARHQHRRFHVLQFTLAGTGLFRWRDPELGQGLKQLEPGDLFMASPDIDFEYRWAGNKVWEFLWVIVEGPWADLAISRLRAARGCPVLSLGSASPLVQSMEQLLQRQVLGLPSDAWGNALLAWDLVTHLLRLGDRGEGDGTVGMEALARQWVLRQANQADCAGLAAHFGYNAKYFSQLFQRQTGTSPAAFILRQKIELARAWLTTTRKPIGRIALDLGFAEDNYFSKVFRRHTGLSPSQYRVRHGSGVQVDEAITL